MMKYLPKISVIVPIYNVEKYLDRCVESLVNQSYTNIEIILVDDGSPDRCPQMCDEYAQKYSNIKSVHKENGGLSDARNYGMKYAEGEYISFIDSDDWIDTQTYEIIMGKMLETNSDIGAFNALLYYEGDELNPDLSEEYEVMNSQQAIECTIDDIKIKTNVWNKVYKRSIVDDLEFPKGRLNEDEFYTFKVLDRAENIIYVHRQCYYYFQRSNSIMGEYKLNRLDMLDGVWERYELVKQKYPEIEQKAKVTFAFCCLYHYQKLIKNKSVDIDKVGRKKIKFYRKRVHISKAEVGNMPFINRISILMCNSSFGMSLIAKLRNIMKYGI